MTLRLKAVDLSQDGWAETTLSQNLQDEGKGKVKGELATPLKTLTTASIEGSGVFDVLMKAVKLHLQEEYNEGRITGQDYSNVYLGSMTAALQTATQFLLNEQQVHQINAQIGLIRQQTVTELANTDDSIPNGLGFNFIPNEPTPIPPIS